MRTDLHFRRTPRATSLGAAYVEVLVIVGVVVTLGLVAILALGSGASAKADQQAECIKSFDCNGGGAPPPGGLAAVVGSPGAVGTPSSSGGGAWQNVKDFGYGVGAEAWGLVTGTYQAVRHPIQTAEGLAFVVQHPVMTWNAIHDEWAGRSTAENLGRGVLELATLIGPGAITKITKAAEVASDVGRAAEVARTAEATAEAAAAADRIAAAERAAAEARAVAAAERRAAEEAACPGGICEVAGNCFAAGTPVLTPHGEKAIEDVAVGDVVVARDEATGETRQEHVSQLFVTPDREVVDLELTPDAPSTLRGEHLTVTAEHPFYAPGRGFLPVRDLEIGMHVTTAGGTATVSSLKALPTKITVYNFEVEDAHTYFVGRLAAWVHNVCAAKLESDIAKMPPGERVAAVKTAVNEYAQQQGWVKDSKLSRMNGRDVFKDPKTGDLYATDTQHGRIEVLNSKGVHQGEMNVDGKMTKPADGSGGHNLKIK